MPSPRLLPRPHARPGFALSALIALVTLVVTTGACSKSAPPPVGLGPKTEGPLVFPPPLDGWSAREPIPARKGEARDPSRVHLASPSVDKDGRIEVSGKAVHLYFDDTVVDDLKKAPKITITPAVPAKTVWNHGAGVDLVADAPFDPEVEYTITLPDLVASSGKKLTGFRVAFKPKLEIEISGKTLTYVPEKGKARVIATLPLGDDKIGGTQEVHVVFDQPVDLALAKSLVRLEGADGKDLPSTVSHLAGTTFEGQRVDPRAIVVVRPPKPLAPGASFVVHARSQKEGEEEKKRTLTVAEPTKFVAVSCRGGCEVEGTRVLGNAHVSLEIELSNPANRVLRTENVTVTPAVKNLWVSGYDRKVHVSGAFDTSRTYTIRFGGGRDDFGGPVAPLMITFETRPLPASLTMAEGPLLAGDAVLRALPVTARNVERAEARLWALPPGDVAAFTHAMKIARAGGVPSGDPTAVVPFTPTTPRDQLGDVSVDLSAKVERGRVYVVQLAPTTLVPKAEPATLGLKHGGGRDDEKTAISALLVAAAPGAVGVHVHQVGSKAIVQAFALESGEPAPNAKVTIGASSATTDATGTAVLAADAPEAGDDLVARVEAGGTVTLAPFGGPHAVRAKSLFPDLVRGGDGSEAISDETVGLVVTDRGVYRPGSKVRLKGFVRRLGPGGAKAASGTKVRLHVTDGADQEVSDELVTTGERGTFTRDLALDKDAKTGRWHLKLELDGPKRLVLADETVRVAAFEAPRFKVDVEPVSGAAEGHLQAKVAARYLFGGGMGGASVAWSLRANRVAVQGGALADQGLSFEDDGWFGDEREAEPKDPKPVVGEGKLDAAGTLVVDAAYGALRKAAPTELVLDADVSDASNRHVVGVLRSTVHGAPRYAGLRLAKRFGAPGPVRVDLGVVDTKGAAVPGVKVGARLERLDWTRTAEKAESGALVEQWKDTATPVGACEVTSEAKPASCELVAPKDGSYRVVTTLDGHDGPRVSYWAWGSDRNERSPVPSSGKKVPLVLDKGRYKAGETAKLLVQSPFPAATALLTVEQGGLVRHEAKRFEGPSTTFEVPLVGASTPWVHAVVTLLPIGVAEADYRVGAVRVQVSDEGARLAVKVSSAKPIYEVKDDAEITIEVTRGGAPVKDADVTLAVVDEGVLRLTNHHAKDPTGAFHPGRDLAFRTFDTRGWLVRRREKAHVAGGGGSEGEDGLDTRRKFVETAAFVTDLVTDATGKVRTKVTLPDNLTEFRMMAVAVDEAGAGGAAESSFVVTKPVMLDPVMPRFAMRGDAFEAAAMVHNTTDAPIAAKVTVAGQLREVTIPAKGRTRVAVPFEASQVGTRTLRFAVEALGKVRDAVEIPFRTDLPGLVEHPAVSGVLEGTQEITLAVPKDALFEDDAALSIKTGSALYPELGQRLAYLLDYPHGCVEQTASSTLPLLAARTLLPWTGVASISDEEILKRIRVGVERFATMTTPEGGLAYWPGGHEPNTWGTAYALRALVLAREAGVERPKLIDGVTTYLANQLDTGDKDTRVFVAESLAMAGKLPESSADALWDLREKLDVFGTASLAIALGSLPNQDDRVKQLADGLEASFDDKGTPKKAKDEDGWATWSSSDRDRAQALLALVKHRPTSKLAPLLAERLARRVDGYTTQTTAWSLLAMSAFVGSKTPAGGVDVKLRLEGHILDTTRNLGGDNKEVRVPLKELAGKKLTLVLQGDGKTPSAFALDAVWRRALDAQDGRVARRAPHGASIHRFYTDAKGAPVDLASVKAGQVVRVALRVQQPRTGGHDLAWIAVEDRLPAGFEPIDPELATVGSLGALGDEHPLRAGDKGALEGCWTDASHVDLRDDRVQVYYDRVWGSGDRCLFATYLVRATTPGTFVLPPAHGELMYEPGSDGYSDAARVRVTGEP